MCSRTYLCVERYSQNLLYNADAWMSLAAVLRFSLIYICLTKVCPSESFCFTRKLWLLSFPTFNTLIPEELWRAKRSRTIYNGKLNVWTMTSSTIWHHMRHKRQQCTFFHSTIVELSWVPRNYTVCVIYATQELGSKRSTWMTWRGQWRNWKTSIVIYF